MQENLHNSPPRGVCSSLSRGYSWLSRSTGFSAAQPSPSRLSTFNNLAGEPWNRAPSRSGGDKFREAVTDYWMPALDAFRPELIYISAGFDAHREDDMGNLGLVEADYEWVTKQLMQVANRHCKGRIISCLGGGYVLTPRARSVSSKAGRSASGTIGAQAKA